MNDFENVSIKYVCAQMNINGANFIENHSINDIKLLMRKTVAIAENKT